MLFTSCTNTYNQRLESLIKDIVNDTIIINDSIEFIQFNTFDIKFDIYKFQSSKNNFSLITYFPNIACTPCLIEDINNHWNEIQSHINTNCCIPYNILFVFESEEITTLTKSIMEQQFVFPYYIDSQKKFAQNNPKIKSFPGITFLIDSCHCIKLLSIPTQSQQSKEILLNFIKDYN